MAQSGAGTVAAGSRPATLRAGERWALMAAVTLAMSLSYVDRQALSVLAPTVTRALAISDASYGWLASAFSVAYLAAGPLAGLLVDRVGARRGLLAGVVVWSAVAALHALAPGFGALVALRLALGVAESPTFPAGAQAVQRALPPVARARGMSFLFVGMSVGGLIAAPVAIGIATASGWRAAFLGTAGLALAWAPLWLLVTGRPAVRAALDHAGGAAARATVRETVAHPALLRGIAGLLAIVPASAFAMAWEAKYYARQFGLPQASLVPYLMSSALAYDAGAVVFGDLASRRARRLGERGEGAPPPRGLLACGAALAAVGLAGLARAGAPGVALAFFVASGAGRGAVVTLCNADALARVPARAVSAAGGVIASAQALGGIVVNPVLGLAVQRLGYAPALTAIALFTVPGTVAWLAWKPPPSEPA
jgi:ACS family hexuronate transporter-like MFS transporter